MPGSATAGGRGFLGTAYARIYAAGKLWANSAAGADVWELRDLLHPLEREVDLAQAAETPWNAGTHRRLRSLLLALERFGRLHAPNILKHVTQAIPQLEARLKLEESDGFDVND